MAVMVVLLAGSIRASRAQDASLLASGTAQDVGASAAVGPALIGADGDEFTQVFAAQALGWSGRGVRLCLIDDALDIYHPNFGACTGVNQPRYPTCRVYWGWNGGLSSDRSTPGNHSDPTPKIPGQDHGTHVAGIMAGSFPAKLTDRNGKPLPYQRGVAHRALVGIFKVSDDYFGGLSSAAIMYAMRTRVQKARCRIVNMSFGGDPTLSEAESYTKPIAAMTAADILPVAAAGNSGSNRGPALFSALAPGNLPGVLAVANLNNTVTPGALLEIDRPIPTADGERSLLVAAQRSDISQSVCMPSCEGIKLPLEVYLLRTTPLNQGCLPLDWVSKPPGTLEAAQGKVLLLQFGEGCERRSTDYRDLWQSLDELKPALVLFAMPPVDGNVFGNMREGQVPLMWLRSDDGLALAQAVAAADPAAPIKLVKVPGATTVDMPAAYARQPTNTSSMGPAYDLSIKPDIAAPGTLYSSVPDHGYASMRGTSMASPYVAGVAGLWLESKLKASSGFAPAGGWTQAAFTALQNTAKPWAFPGSSLMWPPAKVGAGVVQAKNAILTTVGISPRQLHLRTDATVQRLTLKLTNSGSTALTYKAVHRPAVGLSLGLSWYKDAYDADAPTAEVSVTPDVVTVSAGGKASVMVTVITPEALRARDDIIFSGYITFTPASGTPSTDAKGQAFVSDPIPLSVPYQGSSRDYSSGGTSGTSGLALLAPARYDLSPAQAALAARGAHVCNNLNIVMETCDFTTGIVEVKSYDQVTINVPLVRPVADYRFQVWNQDGNQLLGTSASQGEQVAAVPYTLTELRWDGSWVPANATANSTDSVELAVGQVVRLKLLFWPPVAVGDLAAGRRNDGMQPFVVPVAGAVTKVN